MNHGLIRRRVVIIDDVFEYESLLKMIIREQGFHLVAHHRSFQAARRNIQRDSADIYLIGIDRQKYYQEQISILATQTNAWETIVIAGECLDETILRSFKAGATGFLLKNEGVVELATRLRSALQGGVAVSRSVSKILIGQFHRNTQGLLTKREMEIVALIARQKTFSEISSQLFIARDTVKTHVRNVYSKLNVNSKSTMLSRVRKERII